MRINETPVSTEGSGVAKEFTIHDVKRIATGVAYLSIWEEIRLKGDLKKDPRIKTYNLLKENGEK